MWVGLAILHLARKGELGTIQREVEVYTSVLALSLSAASELKEWNTVAATMAWIEASATDPCCQGVCVCCC